jgi:hypothetical protein
MQGFRPKFTEMSHRSRLLPVSQHSLRLVNVSLSGPLYISQYGGIWRTFEKYLVCMAL